MCSSWSKRDGSLISRNGATVALRPSPNCHSQSAMFLGLALEMIAPKISDYHPALSWCYFHLCLYEFGGFCPMHRRLFQAWQPCWMCVAIEQRACQYEHPPQNPSGTCRFYSDVLLAHSR